MELSLDFISFTSVILFAGFYMGRYMFFDLKKLKHISLMTVIMTLLMSYLLLEKSVWFLLLVLARVLTMYIVDIVSNPTESSDITYTEKVLINPENNMLTSTIFYTVIDLFLYTLYYINNTSF